MKKPSTPSAKPSWIKAQTSDNDKTIDNLVMELQSRYENTERNELALSERDQTHLTQRFKLAEMGRSPLRKFMIALLKEAGIKDYNDAVEIVPLKTWERAVDKLYAPGRKLNDLGRGCIYIDSAEDVEKIMKLIKKRTKAGYITAVSDSVFIIDGSLDNYFETPRKSGYAGSLNFDIQASLGKNRSENFEIQIRPKSRHYSDAYDWSHRLYDMIRILDEIPETFSTERHKEIRDLLVQTNAAIYDEQAERTGYGKLRKTPLRRITETEHDDAIGILDEIRIKIDSLAKENDGWSDKTMEALSYAKTSVTQIHIATKRLERQEIALQHKSPS